ncbi:MAG: GNAT family N-acetyltransferase [Candidatus Korobacteraceae bacterium]
MRAEGEKATLSPVELLTRSHTVEEFDCGMHESLNEWLKRYAMLNQLSDAARTYVVHRANKVVGYYSLAPGSVAKREAPERIAKGLGNYPIGVILLARLAIDKTEKGRGLGKALLKDALLRSANAADTISARAVLVHAIDGDAKAFYQHFGFEVSLIDDTHLMLLMKDIRALLKK